MNRKLLLQNTFSIKYLFLVIVTALAFTNLNAQTCQCVDYVKKRYTIIGGVGNNGAKAYGSVLTNKSNNFTKESIPQNKDIVVIQADCRGALTQGHIGLIASVETDKKGNVTAITVVGANQHQSSEWAEKGCGNVSTMRIANPTASCHAYYRNLSKFVN